MQVKRCERFKACAGYSEGKPVLTWWHVAMSQSDTGGVFLYFNGWTVYTYCGRESKVWLEKQQPPPLPPPRSSCFGKASTAAGEREKPPAPPPCRQRLGLRSSNDMDTLLLEDTTDQQPDCRASSRPVSDHGSVFTVVFFVIFLPQMIYLCVVFKRQIILLPHLATMEFYSTLSFCIHCLKVWCGHVIYRNNCFLLDSDFTNASFFIVSTARNRATAFSIMYVWHVAVFDMGDPWLSML